MDKRKEIKTEVSKEAFLENIALLSQQFSGFHLKKASQDIELSMNGMNVSARIYTTE